jgi:hypothetical protein
MLKISLVLLLFLSSFKCSRTNRRTNLGSSNNKTTIPFNRTICGIMSEAYSLVQGGKLSDRAQFPWLAAISINHSGGWVHSGSGSLISHRHVIARARSVSIIGSSNYLIPVEVDKLEIYLGSTKYYGLSENSFQKTGVEKIVNHPFAKKASSTLYVNAISMIVTNRDVLFTNFVLPVCLWPFIDNHINITGRDAYVASYGYGLESPRKHARVTVQDTCTDHFEDELKFRNETNFFCVKGDATAGPCTGDNQLFMKINANWYLKGFISSVYKLESGECNLVAPTLCEDIQQNVLMIRVLML